LVQCKILAYPDYSSSLKGILKVLKQVLIAIVRIRVIIFIQLEAVFMDENMKDVNTLGVNINVPYVVE
jgi:hypothetical protein